MTRNELFTKLNKLCNKLDEQYSINHGGCCFVAATLARQLEKYNIPFSVIYYNLCGTHFAIKVSDRIINRAEYRKREIEDIYFWNSEYLYETYYSEDWNPTYNTQYNLVVEEKIKSVFKRYGNSRKKLCNL